MAKKKPKDGCRVVVRCTREELERWKKCAAPRTLSDYVRLQLGAS